MLKDKSSIFKPWLPVPCLFPLRYYQGQKHWEPVQYWEREGERCNKQLRNGCDIIPWGIFLCQSTDARSTTSITFANSISCAPSAAGLSLFEQFFFLQEKSTLVKDFFSFFFPVFILLNTVKIVSKVQCNICNTTCHKFNVFLSTECHLWELCVVGHCDTTKWTNMTFFFHL